MAIPSSSTIRGLIRRYPEFMGLKADIEQRYGGKFPCCGELEKTFKNQFFKIFVNNEKLQQKIKRDNLLGGVIDFYHAGVKYVFYF